MPREQDNRNPKKNATEEKLRGTPFDSVSDLDRESNEIRRQIWRRFKSAQVIDELVTKDEFKFIKEEWETGVSCAYGAHQPKQICRVFSSGRGLKVEINEDFVKTLGESNALHFLEAAVRSNLEGFGAIYYRVRSLLPGASGENLISESERGMFNEGKD